LLKICVGQKYAETVLAPLLALVVKNFSISTRQRAEDITVLYQIAGIPFPQVEIMFEKRGKC